jgi:hypothetical protein
MDRAVDLVGHARLRAVEALDPRRLALGLAFAVCLSPAPVWAGGAKPEDVFKGKIIITEKRLPMKFPSAAAFVQAVNRAKVDRVWPREEKGNDHAEWNIEYIAFFAQPLADNEVTVKFFDVTGGAHRFVAGDSQYTRERNSRVFASSILVAKPEFEHNKRYMMTVQTGGRVIASTMFWLRGKGPNYSGKVEFSDEETKGK